MTRRSCLVALCSAAAVLGTLACVVGLVGYGAYRLVDGVQAAVAPFFQPGPPDLNPDYVVEVLPHTGMVVTVAFSPDGKYLAAGTQGNRFPDANDDEGDVRVWDVATQKLLGSISLDQWVTGLAFAPDSRLLLVSTSFMKIRNSSISGVERDVPGVLHVLRAPDLHELQTKRFDLPIGEVACANDGKTVGVIQVSAEELRGTGARFQSPVYGTGAIVLLDAESLEMRQTIGPPYDLRSGFVFTADSQQVIADDQNAKHPSRSWYRAFDVATGKEADALFQGGPPMLLLSHDGTQLIAHGGTHAAIYDLKRQKPARPESFPRDVKKGSSMTTAALSPDDKQFLVGFSSGHRVPRTELVLQDRASGAQTPIDKGFSKKALCAAFSSDNIHFAVGTSFYHEQPGDARPACRVLLFHKK